MDAKRSTGELLVGAASEEFRAHGFLGTDTNKIARRAGFAPQTFYRWYEDKIEVFIKVYEYWARLEADSTQALLARHASNAQVAEAITAHHKAYLKFRRSLRLLALEHPRVRAARAETRRGQIASVVALQGAHALPAPRIAAALLVMERLADALAEDELVDMGVDPAGVAEELARLVGGLRTPME